MRGENSHMQEAGREAAEAVLEKAPELELWVIVIENHKVSGSYLIWKPIWNPSNTVTGKSASSSETHFELCRLHCMQAVTARWAR